MKEIEIKHDKWGFSFYKKLKTNNCSDVEMKEILETNDHIFASFLIAIHLNDSKLSIGQIKDKDKLVENWWVEYKDKSKVKVIDSREKKIYNRQDYCAIEIMSFDVRKLDDENFAYVAYLATGKRKKNINFIKDNKILTPNQERYFIKFVTADIAAKINKKLEEEYKKNGDKEFDKIEQEIKQMKRNIIIVKDKEKKTN